jgi:predicted RNA-binding Zn ribbon-like protein
MASRPSAPGSLSLVEEFLRTRNEITDAAGLDRWCAGHGLPDAGPGAYERALRLREALRSLMLANNGGPAAPDALAVVNEEIRTCGLRPEITSDGVRWPADETRPGDRLLAAVLGGVITAMTDGSWPRMKACAADDCRYAFYDHTRNRSGRWCDVSGCGANARMRAYRKRRT